MISAIHCCLVRSSVDKVSGTSARAGLGRGTFKAVAINNRTCTAHVSYSIEARMMKYKLKQIDQYQILFGNILLISTK